MKRSHGKSGTRLYGIWNEMKRRCRNPNFIYYRNYGGKGISVCDDWIQSFSVFEQWALSHGYKNDLTIERKDNSRGYNPDNCKWATRLEQGRNTSRVKVGMKLAKQIKIDLANGITQQKIADKYGLGRSTVGHIARGATWSNA